MKEGNGKSLEILRASFDQTAEWAGEELAQLLIKHRRQKILLLLSGGSALAMLDFLPEKALGAHLTVTTLDERFSFNHQELNFFQLKNTAFYRRLVGASANIFDCLPNGGDSLLSLANRFEQSLRRWRDDYRDGAVIATFGIGEDGHLAGIMPFPEDSVRFQELFEDERKWVIGYDAGEKNSLPRRVTVTFSFLRKNLTAGVCFVAGRKKRTAIKRVLASTGSLAETPARILREFKDLKLVTDVLV
jgi:6-phosphogluconolactonase/glucosamine-6-phosphate isomerase/deaminase